MTRPHVSSTVRIDNVAAHRRSCDPKFIIASGEEVDAYRLAIVHLGDMVALRVYCPHCGRLLQENPGVPVAGRSERQRGGVMGELRVLAEDLPAC